MSMALRNYINLLSNGVEYIGDKQLTQFRVTNVEMIRKGSDYLFVEITLKRITSYHVLSTFGPTLTLLIIAIVTLFIEESHFEATIMLAITSMLVMYTLFQSVSASLPQTAYLKMIDVWLIFGLVLPFFIFLVLILIEMMNDNNDKEDDAYEDQWASNNQSNVNIGSSGTQHLELSSPASYKSPRTPSNEDKMLKRQSIKGKIKKWAKNYVSSDYYIVYYRLHSRCFFVVIGAHQTNSVYKRL